MLLSAGAVAQVEVWVEALTRAVVEVVLGVEAFGDVVIIAEVFHTLGLGDGLILARHMVGHEVDDDLQACLVGAGYECLKLLHALLHVDGQVGVYVVVVADGIG